jgi:hypothetical protein
MSRESSNKPYLYVGGLPCEKTEPPGSHNAQQKASNKRQVGNFMVGLVDSRTVTGKAVTSNAPIPPGRDTN